MPTLLLIALGGALGSVARHLLTNVMQSPVPGTFPWGTLCVNVAGCLVIGVVAAAVGSGWNVRPEFRLALTAGVLGGFTTFSSFGVQTLELWLAGKQVQAGVYVLASNAMGLAAVVLGYSGVKTLA
jgi:fluoride exporter